MTGFQTTRSGDMVTHWPRCKADLLVGTLPKTMAKIAMQIICNTLAKVLVC